MYCKRFIYGMLSMGIYFQCAKTNVHQPSVLRKFQPILLHVETYISCKNSKIISNSFGVEKKSQLDEIKEFNNRSNIVKYIRNIKKKLVSSRIKIKYVFNNVIILKLKTKQVLILKKEKLKFVNTYLSQKETCTSSKSYWMKSIGVMPTPCQTLCQIFRNYQSKRPIAAKSTKFQFFKTFICPLTSSPPLWIFFPIIPIQGAS